MMKWFARTAVLGAGVVVIGASGCVQLAREQVVAQRTVEKGLILDRTVTQSSEEHMHSLAGVVEHDARALVEDLDVFWQRDRPTRLTRWHER
jgi:hypothetical protein